MTFMKFSDWVLARESSAWTRLRKDAKKGLKPKPPAAAVHSRSTAGPRDDYTKGKKCASKKMKKEATFDLDPSDLGEIPAEDLGLGESDKKMQKNPKLAGFLDQIESLKGDLKVLEDAIDKKKKEPKEEPKEEPKPEPKDEKEPKEEPKEEEPKEEEKEEKED
jgi:hypothetical protein